MSARTRVAFVLWSGLVGGAESMTLSLAEAIAEYGVDATVVFVTSAGNAAERLDRAGVAWAECGYARGRQAATQPRALTEAIAAAAADVVVLQNAGFLSRALRRGGFSGPVIAVQHGLHAFAAETDGALDRLRKSVVRTWSAGSVDCAVAVSEYVGEELRRYTPGRVEVIHNGVNLETFSPAAEGARAEDPAAATPLRVGFAARMIAGKGASTMVDVAALLRDRPVEFVLAGGGELEQSVRDQVSARGLESSVEVLGSVSDMAGFWRSVDVAVVPTHGLVEAFGMTAVEAMACGVPVVASRTGGLPEIVDAGVTGFLVTPGSASEIAERLVSYTESPALRAQHATAARQRAEARFGIEQTAQRYAELARELTATERPDGSPVARVLHVGPLMHARGGVAQFQRLIKGSDLARRYQLDFVGLVDDRGWRGVGATIRGLRMLSEQLRRGGVDLVHIHMASRMSFVRKAIAARMARRAGARVVIHLHGGGFDRFVGSLPGPMRSVVRRTFESADAIIVLSDEWERRVRAFATPKRIVVVHNPVELPVAPGRDCASHQVVFVGRISASKGVGDLLAAIALLQSEGVKARLVLAGDGEVAEFQRVAAQLPHPGAVRFTGWLDRTELADVLRSSCAFCLPSHREGVPLSLLEAMSYGLACVATSVGGVPSVIDDGENGILVPPHDPAALAAALREVLTDTSRALSLGDSAAETVATSYSVESCASAVADLYAQLLESARGTNS